MSFRFLSVLLGLVAIGNASWIFHALEKGSGFDLVAGFLMIVSVAGAILAWRFSAIADPHGKGRS